MPPNKLWHQFWLDSKTALFYCLINSYKLRTIRDRDSHYGMQKCRRQLDQWTPLTRPWKAPFPCLAWSIIKILSWNSDLLPWEFCSCSDSVNTTIFRRFQIKDLQEVWKAGRLQALQTDASVRFGMVEEHANQNNRKRSRVM